MAEDPVRRRARRTAKRIERQPVQEEHRAIFQQQRDARAMSVSRSRVFRAQPVDLGLKRAVREIEAIGCIGQSRRRGRQHHYFPSGSF